MEKNRYIHEVIRGKVWQEPRTRWKCVSSIGPWFNSGAFKSKEYAYRYLEKHNQNGDLSVKKYTVQSRSNPNYYSWEDFGPLWEWIQEEEWAYAFEDYHVRKCRAVEYWMVAEFTPNAICNSLVKWWAANREGR